MSQLTMYRGDTKTVTVTVQPVDASGNQVLGSGGIAGWSFWMTAKRDPSDLDSQAVFQKLPAAWSISSAGDATHPGVAFCNLAPADTASLPPYQLTLVYDIQAKDLTGNIFTIDAGAILVNVDITIATS